MPMHDWKKVPDGIFHAFHHRWISAISDELDAGVLPSDYYALPEQVAAGRNPDVLTPKAAFQSNRLEATTQAARWRRLRRR